MEKLSFRVWLTALVIFLLSFGIFFSVKNAFKVYEVTAIINYAPQVTEFQKVRSLLNSLNNWNRFTKDSQIDPAIAARIRSKLEGKDALDDNISLLMTLSKQDIKQYGDLQKILKDGDKLVAGIRLTDRQSSPQTALKTVEIMLQYLMQTLWQYDLNEKYASRNFQIKPKLLDIQNKRIAVETEIKNQEEKKNKLAALVKTYPNPTTNDTRLTVNLANDEERFLSPRAQVVAVESQIINSQVKLIKLLREEKQLKIQGEIYDEFAKQAEISSLGQVTNEKYLSILNAREKSITDTDDAVLEIFNTIRQDLLQKENLYVNDVKYLSYPVLPDKPVGTNWLIFSLMGSISCVVLYFIFLFRREVFVFIKSALFDDTENEERQAQPH